MTVPSQLLINLALGGFVLILIVAQMVCYNRSTYALWFDKLKVFLTPLTVFFVLVVFINMIKSLL